MPLINHVRGDQVPDAMLNVRTPIVRIPLWATLTWSALRGLFRLVMLYLRFWYVTLPTSGLLWLYLRYGWIGPTLAVTTPTIVLAAWALGHPVSFRRFAWWPTLGRVRRFRYRRGWYPAMATANLAVTFDSTTVLPVLVRVRTNGIADTLTVRMVTGQIPDDFAAASERLTHTFGARGATVTPGRRPDLVTITLLRTDPLAAIVPPLPVPATPDFTALPVALREDGDVYGLRLFGTQVLIVGATGAGKGSVIWAVVRVLAAGVEAGLVQLWAFDPKGGMELGAGAPLFARFACDDYPAMADMLDEALALARSRAARLRGVTRQHTPTIAEPLVVIIIDELAALTAYLSNRQLKDRIKATLPGPRGRGARGRRVAGPPQRGPAV
jgi:S-DNA-T family DNA segregation ATPase FtsK/SpoIIIE